MSPFGEVTKQKRVRQEIHSEHFCSFNGLSHRNRERIFLFQVAAIKEAFGCVASSLVQLVNGDRECSIATLADWDYDPQNQSQAEIRCDANCQHSCERWNLQLNVVTSNINKNFRAFAQLDIFVKSFDYVVYQVLENTKK